MLMESFVKQPSAVLLDFENCLISNGTNYIFERSTVWMLVPFDRKHEEALGLCSRSYAKLL